MKVYSIVMRHGKRWPNIIAQEGRPTWRQPHVTFDPEFHTYDPTRLLDFYSVASCIGCFSQRIASELRPLCGPTLVEYPVTVDGRQFHLFVSTDPIDAFDMARVEFEYLHGREQPISFKRAAFLDEVVGHAPRIFHAQLFFGPFINEAGFKLVQSLTIEGILLWRVDPPKV